MSPAMTGGSLPLVTSGKTVTRCTRVKDMVTMNEISRIMYHKMKTNVNIYVISGKEGVAIKMKTGNILR